VARRIERASSILGGPDRIAYVHTDCGFWMLSRSIADGKIRSLVSGRDVYEGSSRAGEVMLEQASSRHHR
jgi:5-methyltetrahydropteroyltriglutamate--homocysteine methyltransferase